MGIPAPSALRLPSSASARSRSLFWRSPSRRSVLYARLSASAWGKAMRAVRDSETASHSIGLDPTLDPHRGLRDLGGRGRRRRRRVRLDQQLHQPGVVSVLPVDPVPAGGDDRRRRPHVRAAGRRASSSCCCRRCCRSSRNTGCCSSACCCCSCCGLRPAASSVCSAAGSTQRPASSAPERRRDVTAYSRTQAQPGARSPVAEPVDQLRRRARP